MVGRLPVHQLNNTFALAPSTTIITVIKSKGNSYSKSGIDKCYRCGETGHRSNECPKMKQANIADYRDEGEGVMIEEASDSDFAQEHGDHVARVVQKLLCNQNFHFTMTSNLLFKIFGQEQGMHSHH